jgi:hypothetical protein
MTGWQDPPAGRITFDEWDEQFRRIPDELIDRYRYFSADGRRYPWATYLFPPTSFAIYGSRHLRRLRFDNSLAALRMWGFVMNETERLFRARQIGKPVVALMGDLGGTPPLVLACLGLPFYPDCIWWLPFMNESNVLFDAAAKMGLGESACYSRAALGAFMKRAYFPDPVLCVAATGASCDDFSAVEQLVESLGFPVFWFELPLRKEHRRLTVDSRQHTAYRAVLPLSAAYCMLPTSQRFATTSAGVTYQESAQESLVEQFQILQQRLADVLGAELNTKTQRHKEISLAPSCLSVYSGGVLVFDLAGAIRKVNRVRALVQNIKRLAYSAPAPIFPALEMMVIEFGSLHFYSDIDEWTKILEHIEQTLQRRWSGQEFMGSPDSLRVIWVTPPADPLLLSYAEDQGLRVVGTEYVIAQALNLIPETDDPISGLAENLLNASLIGSSRARAENVIQQARAYRAEGIIISGILGGSHCASETGLIREYVSEALGIPVLAFDVPAPGASVQTQIQTRIEAFIEVLRARDERPRREKGKVGG